MQNSGSLLDMDCVKGRFLFVNIHLHNGVIFKTANKLVI